MGDTRQPEFTDTRLLNRERDGPVLERTLDEAMRRFERARAVIVDVTMNEGGFDHLARAVAARFAADRVTAYSKFAGDDPAAAPQPVDIVPAAAPRFPGPVYVLTSELTVSAAEIFTLAMRALPNVVHVGESTRGSLSDLLGKPLPNGWELTLSNEVYLDADGILWEGRGVRPEIAMEVFSKADVTRGHVDAVRKVVDLIDAPPSPAE
jgi:carboxyl-terminal processing protease